MATYTSSDIVITFGGHDMTAYITKINGTEVDLKLENNTPFGVGFETFISTALKSMKPIQIEGLYDDTATTGPDVVFNTLGTAATLVVTYGSTKTTSVSAIPQNYKRTPVVGSRTKYMVSLQPTGTITEA